MTSPKTSCERCAADLPSDSPEARVCAFGCTFCAGCAEGLLLGVCPNCGGELLRRPRPRIAPPTCGPRRVVCLSQETAETLALLGLEERVVGLSRFVTRPRGGFPRAERIGGFSSTDIEAIRALEPDLVLCFSDVQARIAGELVAAGLELHVFNHRDLAGMLRMVRLLGHLFGVPGRGELLASRLERGIEQARSAPAEGPRPRVYFEEWDEPMVCGITWVSELIELAGGTDVFAELARRPGAEQRVLTPADVVAAAPDVILASWCGKPFKPDAMRARPGWRTIPAVANGRLFELEGGLILSPGPGLVEAGLARLSELLRALPGAAEG